MKNKLISRIALAILPSLFVVTCSLFVASAASLPASIKVGQVLKAADITTSRTITVEAGTIITCYPTYTTEDRQTLTFTRDATSIIVKLNGETIGIAAGEVSIINILDMDYYAYYVVPNEMGASWPIEALKAQAVCARNYAAIKVNQNASQNSHKNQGFDICNTVHCQVYNPSVSLTANQRQTMDTVIASTKGVVATYNGQIAQLYYAASTGGWTEDVTNVWNSNLAYLKAVKSPDVGTEGGSNTYWTKTISQSELTTRLQSRGHNLGTIQNVEIIKSVARSGVTATITELKVTGTQAAKTFTREQCRTEIGVNSQAYTIQKNAAGLSSGISAQDKNGKSPISGSVSIITSSGISQKPLAGSVIQSAGGKTTVSQDGNISGDISWTFTGRGWGHLVGMSQEGAKVMANNGKRYDEILKHYYTGITLQ